MRCVPRGDPLRSTGIFHLCAACKKTQNNVCPRFISLKCIFLIQRRSSQPARLPEYVHLSCLRKRIACLNPSSTVLSESDSSVDDSGKQEAHFEAGITVYMEHFSCFVLAAPYFYGSTSRGNGLIPALRVKSFMLSVLQPLLFTQQHTSRSHITFNLFSQLCN